MMPGVDADDGRREAAGVLDATRRYINPSGGVTAGRSEQATPDLPSRSSPRIRWLESREDKPGRSPLEALLAQSWANHTG
jgi:hypothetical protein